MTGQGWGTSDASFWELRIHGVAGTSAESLLEVGVSEVEYGLPTGLELTGRGRRVPRDRRAFSWGSLTSGRPWHAFNILLLPFMLSNVAGWMLPSIRPNCTAERPPWQGRLATAMLRLHGLALTVLWSTFVALAFLDVAPSVAGAIVGERIGAWVGYVLALSSIAALAILTTVAPRDPWRPLWPKRSPLVVERARTTSFEVDPDGMWSTPQTVAHSHRPHTAVAFSVIAATVCTAALAVGGITFEAWPPRVVGELAENWVALSGLVAASACIAISAGFLVAMSWSAGRPLHRVWSAVARWLAGLLGALSVVMAGASLSRLPIEPTETLPGLRGTLVVAAVAVLVAAVAVAVLEFWTSRLGSPGTSGLQVLTGPSVMLLAGATGAVYGAGFLLGGMEILAGPLTGRAEKALTKIVTPAVLEWVALVFLVLALLVVVIGGIRLASLVQRQNPDLGSRPMSAVRQLVSQPTRLVVFLGALGVIGFIALYKAVRECTRPGATPWGFEAVALDSQECLRIGSSDLVWGLGAVLLVTVAVIVLIAIKGPWRWVGFLIFLLAGLTLLLGVIETTLKGGWTGRLEWLAAPAWLPPYDPSLSDVAVFVAFTAPVLAIGTRMVYGFRDRSTRRGLAVLWDLTAFWPRWFHPFAQRSYSDTAVSGLAVVLQRRRAAGASTILAPHSQGSVIAVPACLLAHDKDPDAGSLDQVALLTYGSPVRRLYSELFPGMFHAGLLTELAGHLTSPGTGEIRWRNLWRVTDPIGGPIAHSQDSNEDEASTVIDELSDPPYGLADPQNRLHSGYWLEDRYAVAITELRPMFDTHSPPDPTAT
ncbi:hypothetical protein [Salsipaludibacter albus]|uniref:hypothetical protein n=1 Tax=Salsipaludibacter albus TaxID=2849650 RepID=UPI001EE40A64|nr:hypothetical protein [Salsipaludibacter albus]MBY5163142.1 hypothetical protein [Salsipaludibacter albus]